MYQILVNKNMAYIQSVSFTRIFFPFVLLSSFLPYLQCTFNNVKWIWALLMLLV